MSRIYHIARSDAWHGMTSDYQGDTLDSEGFIHCSEAHQLWMVANSLFRGQSDLLLLSIDPTRLSAEIRYESPRGSTELFPHVYGPLNREAVVSVEPLVADSRGRFSAPEGLRAFLTSQPGTEASE